MALIAISALVLASDPRAAIEAAQAGHGAISDASRSCCTDRVSCCGTVPADVATPPPGTSSCSCCLPAPAAPPVETDGRGSATSPSEVVAPDVLPAVTLADLARPISTPRPASLGPVANDPPIFLRTCRLLF